MKKLVGICLAIAFPLVAFGAPRVSGTYANKISKIDIDQIQAAVSKEKGVAHNIRTVDAVRADKVAIQTGGKASLQSETYYDFTVSKRSSKWMVDTSSIQIGYEPTTNHRHDSDAIGR
ncbi:MAG TPA: hypothetical protein VFP82_04015 [Chthoniobacterales bacterium]|nr:hypothetical protein [Chthoniobacterales bacterium]